MKLGIKEGILSALIILCGLPMATYADNGKSKSDRKTIINYTIEPVRYLKGKNLPWDHKIQIALPPSYGNSSKKFPVLWVTDGQWSFESSVTIAAHAARKFLPEMIIIAVGSSSDDAKDIGDRRGYDFTATKSIKASKETLGHDVLNNHNLHKQNNKFGGARDFLLFLTEQLRPLLAKEYRMSDVHTLSGYSMGGLFCTYALFAETEAFNKYICGSGPLYYGKSYVFDLEREYAKQHDDLAADVFLSFGSAEITQDRYDALGLASSMARLAEIVSAREYPSLNLHMKVFLDEDHDWAGRSTIYWGLRSVWQK